MANLLGITLPADVRGNQSKLLRIFFAVEGQKIILLLSGYDKGRDPSRKKQQKMIEHARSLLRQHKNSP